MSAFPDSEISVQDVDRRELSPARFAVIGTTLVVLGALTIWRSLLSLWTMWTTDALKSIGMIVPLVSLVLILRAWRTLHWRADGTWWGLPTMLMAILAAQIQERAVLILVITPDWSTPFPPPALVLLAYGSGAVLLLGGVRLYRAALFPILLLWFANPVPHAFTLLVDLPLQQASAYVARTFAMSLGHSLTPDHLRLMFTPDFGMFIAPGCDGIRGSITMGFLALIAGYIYRFRWFANALVVTGAILLGYLFNLVRLCLLVLYYVVALHFPWLQNKAENADYLIGAALFLLAAVILFMAIHRFRDAGGPNSLRPRVVTEQGESPDHSSRMPYVQLAAMGLIAFSGCVGLVRATAAIQPPITVADAAALRFPARLGNYTLVRTWNEALPTGPVVYVWAQYAPAGGGTPIAIGVSPSLGFHDPLICHFIRGDHPAWQGQLTVVTANAFPVSFSSAFYNDGVTQHIEASTICSGGTCDEFTTSRVHFGLIFTRPTAKSLLNGDPTQPVPVLLKAETLNMALPADVARRQLTTDLREFLAVVKLDDLATP